jgi:predicted enzyme related to lactoylglutathione lyase
MAGEPTFLEIGVPDGDRARTFFAELLGWQVTPMDSGNYLLNSLTIPVGVHSNDEDRIMLVFFSVPDLDSAMKRVVELGGVAEEPRPGGGFGCFAMCNDDQGLRFGLHQPPDSTESS